MAFLFRGNNDWQFLAASILLMIALAPASSWETPRNFLGDGFKIVSWAEESWDNLIEKIDREIELGIGSSADRCALVKQAIGMGESFFEAAECECDEESTKDGFMHNLVTLNCWYDTCIPLDEDTNSPPICGQGQIEISVGKSWPGKRMDLNACTKMDETQRPVCIYYELTSTTDNEDSEHNKDEKDPLDSFLPEVTQSCSMEYEGIECPCTVEDLYCVAIDCSPILPDVVSVNGCQTLSLADAAGLGTWIPDLKVFRKTDEQDDTDATEAPVGDPIEPPAEPNETPTQATDDATCHLLEQATNVPKDLLTCSCEFDRLYCDLDGVAKDFLELYFVSTSEIHTDICVRYNSDQPELSYGYSLPFGDSEDYTEPPSPCWAYYGRDRCTCTIDENSCLSVDCSGVANGVFTKTCQVVDVANPDSLILDISTIEEQQATQTIQEVGKHNKKTGWWIGLVIGIVMLFAVIIGVWWLLRRRKKEIRHEDSMEWCAPVDVPNDDARFDAIISTAEKQVEFLDTGFAVVAEPVGEPVTAVAEEAEMAPVEILVASVTEIEESETFTESETTTEEND